MKCSYCGGEDVEVVADTVMCFDCDVAQAGPATLPVHIARLFDAVIVDIRSKQKEGV